jgi:hypothetical protein
MQVRSAALNLPGSSRNPRKNPSSALFQLLRAPGNPGWFLACGYTTPSLLKFPLFTRTPVIEPGVILIQYDLVFLA